MAQWAQANLQAASIETRLELYEWATWISKFNSGMDESIDIALQDWAEHRLRPVYAGTAFYHCCSTTQWCQQILVQQS